MMYVFGEDYAAQTMCELFARNMVPFVGVPQTHIPVEAQRVAGRVLSRSAPQKQRFGQTGSMQAKPSARSHALFWDAKRGSAIRSSFARIQYQQTVGVTLYGLPTDDATFELERQVRERGWRVIPFPVAYSTKDGLVLTRAGRHANEIRKRERISRFPMLAIDEKPLGRTDNAVLRALMAETYPLAVFGHVTLHDGTNWRVHTVAENGYELISDAGTFHHVDLAGRALGDLPKSFDIDWDLT